MKDGRRRELVEAAERVKAAAMAADADAVEIARELRAELLQRIRRGA